MALYAYENIQLSINRPFDCGARGNRTFSEKIYVFIQSSAETRGARDCAHARVCVSVCVRVNGEGREGGRDKENSSEKSVCFFTSLDFIFESIFFAPTVTHC